MKLNRDQRKALSDFANTIAAAWFTAGVIAPFFTRTKSAGDLVIYLFIGISMSGAILAGSLSLFRRVKS